MRVRADGLLGNSLEIAEPLLPLVGAGGADDRQVLASDLGMMDVLPAVAVPAPRGDRGRGGSVSHDNTAARGRAFFQ